MSITRTLLGALALFSLAAVPSLAAEEMQEYLVDKEHSGLTFEVAHLVISTVRGRFDDFQGTIKVDAKTQTIKEIEGSAKATSINTNQEKRDKHLRSADFFDVEKFPELTLSMKNLSLKKGKSATAKGALTIHGVTKEIPFALKHKGTVKDPYGTNKLALEASAAINRKDFGLTWNDTLETGGVLVGDKVKIMIEIESNQKGAEAKSSKEASNNEAPATKN